MHPGNRLVVSNHITFQTTRSFYISEFEGNRPIDQRYANLIDFFAKLISLKIVIMRVSFHAIWNSYRQWLSDGGEGVGVTTPLPTELQVVTYLRLFLTFCLKRWLFLLLGLSRLFYVNWTRSQRRIPKTRFGG